MKKLLLFIVITITTFSVCAQEAVDADTLWKFNGTTSLNLSQLSLTNWDELPPTAQPLSERLEELCRGHVGRRRRRQRGAFEQGDAAPAHVLVDPAVAD